MGLDSVELIVAFEDYFSITISDSEAEEIFTVQDAVNLIARQKNILIESSTLNENIRNSINTSLNLRKDDFVFRHFPLSDKDFWKHISIQTGLKIPLPIDNREPGSGIRRFISRMIYKPGYNWTGITFERFIEVVCFANYKTLIDTALLKSKYEIYVAVSGITGDKVIDLYEIFPEKSFVKDLGID